MPNPSIVACIVSEISAFIRTDGQMDLARSTRLVILIKNIYFLWGRKRFLLPVTYFPTNLVYPFTLRVTGIKTFLAYLECPKLCKHYFDGKNLLLGSFYVKGKHLEVCHRKLKTTNLFNK